MKKFEITEKFYSSKTLLKMAGGRMHTQHTPHPPWIHPWLHNNKRWPQILRKMLSFSLFSTESQRGQEQLHVLYRSGTALLIKLHHCFINHNGKEHDSENNTTYFS